MEQLARFLGVSCDKAQMEGLAESCNQLIEQCSNSEALSVCRGEYKRNPRKTQTQPSSGQVKICVGQMYTCTTCPELKSSKEEDGICFKLHTYFSFTSHRKAVLTQTVCTFIQMIRT